MLHTRLALALCCAMSIPVVGSVQARPADAGKPGPESQSRWIVRLASPPLAQFRGFADSEDPAKRSLEPTHPAARGERKLDTASKSAKAYLAYLAGERESVLAAASGLLGRPLKPAHVYETVSNGFALDLSAAEAAQLGKLAGVRVVSPDFRARLLTDAGPAFIGAESFWSEPGNDRRGEGVVVGVIDSGVNITHPSFAATSGSFSFTNPRGRFYGLCEGPAAPVTCNNKLIGVWDFTAEGSNGSDTSGHGSHVASTAVGNPVTVGINGVNIAVSGVAPRAHLISYKACVEGDGCDGSALVDAIDQAVADGVDIINYSIGSDPRDPWTDVRSAATFDSEAMLNARAAGVLVVAAAGNDGPTPGSVGAPGNSPWVMAVANTTHNRTFRNSVIDFSGGTGASPGVLHGQGFTGGRDARMIVRAADLGFPLCSQGDDLDFPPTGVSNPWSNPDQFLGAIVVCERGVTSRLAKSNNVRLAGGSGMILINTAADGESTVADEHSIPTVHLGFTAGQELMAWLASGSNHKAAISGQSSVLDDAFGDIVNASSSRGPVEPIHGYLKPDISAPGTDILAAARTGNGGALLTGTSMASPHVAGAAALVLGANPDLDVDQLSSVLTTTGAASGMRLHDGITPATPAEQGGGRVQPLAALDARLFLTVTDAEFRDADPRSGGDPSTLNLPSIADHSCFTQCSFSRRVTAMNGGGSWTVQVEGAQGIGVQVTPSSFTLADGASQTLNIVVTASAPEVLGKWISGAIRLVPGSATVAEQRLPLSIFADPGEFPEIIEIESAQQFGSDTQSFSGTAALPSAQFDAIGGCRAPRELLDLLPDSTQDDPFDSTEDGVQLKFIQLGVGGQQMARAIFAEVHDGGQGDLDLYVGRDLDGNDSAEPYEVICSSLSSGPDEFCVAEVDQPGRYWIMVQNYSSEPQGLQGFLSWDAVREGACEASRFVATGPGKIAQAGDEFPVRLDWNAGGLKPGQRQFGLLRVLADGINEIATIPMRFVRSGQGGHAQRLLAPGTQMDLALGAGEAHDTLFVEVPPNASSLRVRVSGLQVGGDVDLYVGRSTAQTVVPVLEPFVAPAAWEVDPMGTSITAGSNTEEIVISGAALGEGRVYLTPVNRGDTTASVRVRVDMEFGGTAFTPAPGGWFNPGRSGHGINFNAQGDTWVVVWYTYLEDGSPTWYLAQGSRPTASQGVWRADLLRFTWDGDSARSETVGELVWTFMEQGTTRLGWRIHGVSGVESFAPLALEQCAGQGSSAPLFAGHWYPPALPGFGMTSLVQSDGEFHWAYLYDAVGVPRWLFGDAGPLDFDSDQSMSLLQFSGFCPSCEFQVTDNVPAGELTRRYDSRAAGSFTISAGLQTPLTGSWNSSEPMNLLLGLESCPR